MADASERREGISLSHLVLQMGLMCMVLYLWYSPLVLPLKLMVVLFHEMSHGLVAIVTGGTVVEISITEHEGGACVTEGGIPLAIVSAGYLGSMFFGGMMLYLSRLRFYVSLVYGVLVLILGAAVMTVLHDSYSRTFACALAVSFVFLGFLAPGLLGGFFLRAIGTVSCLYSMVDIYSDVLADANNPVAQNDAIIFADLSGVSAETVGVAWLAVSVVFFLAILKASLTEVSVKVAPRKKPRLARA